MVVILPVPGFNVNILALENDASLELKLVTFNRFVCDLKILVFINVVKVLL